MRLSHYFLPLLKEVPSDASIVSHQLMLRTGMVKQVSAGIYSWLPLGFKVMRRIEQIVREEQNRIGALEMLMPTIQPAELWRDSGRYDDYGEEMLRIKDRSGRDLLYGPTNEEVITDIFRSFVKSYKEVPQMLYHIQWKFRDERRPRFGVMRGREFLMKDAYSFDIDEQAALVSYYKMFVAYLNTFARLSLKAIPMRADTGPIGGNLSHEFIILADTGESAVYCDSQLVDMPAPGFDIDINGDLSRHFHSRTNLYAAADDIHDVELFDKMVPKDRQLCARGIEVGHVFYFGDKYTKPMQARVNTEQGDMQYLHMGSYGIGVSRLVGAIIEASHDEVGIIWPKSITPFGVGIINLKTEDDTCTQFCDDLYANCLQANLDPLYDDKNERGGIKFSRMDLIGLPYQIIVGPRGLKEGLVELKDRATDERENLSAQAAIAKVRAAYQEEALG